MLYLIEQKTATRVFCTCPRHVVTLWSFSEVFNSLFGGIWRKVRRTEMKLWDTKESYWKKKVRKNLIWDSLLTALGKLLFEPVYNILSSDVFVCHSLWGMNLSLCLCHSLWDWDVKGIIRLYFRLSLTLHLYIFLKPFSISFCLPLFFFFIYFCHWFSMDLSLCFIVYR